MKITNRVVENYLNCRYKAFLALKGEIGTPHDYEVLMNELAEEYRPKATEALLRRCMLDSAPRIPSVTVDDLQQGHALILDCTIETDQFQFHFDALKRTVEESSLGSFHYQPVMFHHEDNVREAARMLLTCGAFILGQDQEDIPELGTLVVGQASRMTTVQLGKRSQKIVKPLDGLRQIRDGTVRPNVRLNRHCDVCEFRQRCGVEAAEKDDLSLLRGMSDAEIEKHNSRGIFTVHQLSYTFRPRKRPKRTKTQENRYYYALKALAIREKKLYVFGTPNLPTARTSVYIDMEGDTTGHFVYLIGALVTRREENSYHRFWAGDRAEESTIFDSFSTMLVGLDDPTLFHFGSYETRVFRRMLPSMPKSATDVISQRTTNLLNTIYAHLYFPTYSNGLKDIGAFLGCTWSGQTPSGIQSLVWRHQWEREGQESLKETLIRYNYEDCLAAQSVANCIAAVTRQTDDTSQSDLLPNLAMVDNSGHDDHFHNWGRMGFALAGFGSAVKSAYFDYQRHRVYVRTNPNFKKINRAARKQKRRRNRPTKSVEFGANKCTRCTSRNISRNRYVYRSKLGVDLKVMQTGIRRQITKYCHAEHRCRDCGKTFVPPRYKRQQTRGHSMLAWCIYQHVANRTTFEQLETTLADCFGVSLRFSEIYEFKNRAAKYYARTYKRLLRKIVSGELIHADETQISLQHEKGYVWIFANMEEVVYMYMPTRKADFLHPLLESFDGVLVTDFYAGYDGLRCRQQKCLVHLIRDMNASLLKHPYDEELRRISSGFADLQRDILRTIDRVGLRQNHLRRHERSVQKYFGELRETEHRSTVAVALRKRLLKAQGKLFEFLKHDGVPWNNNNAEHAVKHFAKYRRMVKGRLSENGLSDYLVLLSLFQTCRYKGVSYLDFLLSRERDMDRYCKQAW